MHNFFMYHEYDLGGYLLHLHAGYTSLKGHKKIVRSSNESTGGKR